MDWQPTVTVELPDFDKIIEEKVAKENTVHNMVAAFVEEV